MLLPAAGGGTTSGRGAGCKALRKSSGQGGVGVAAVSRPRSSRDRARMIGEPITPRPRSGATRLHAPRRPCAAGLRQVRGRRPCENRRTRRRRRRDRAGALADRAVHRNRHRRRRLLLSRNLGVSGPATKLRRVIGPRALPGGARLLAVSSGYGERTMSGAHRSIPTRRRHCEERSDEAIQRAHVGWSFPTGASRRRWIASLRSQ